MSTASALHPQFTHYALAGHMRLTDSHYLLLPGFGSRSGPLSLQTLEGIAVLEALTTCADVDAALASFIRNNARSSTAKPEWLARLPRAPWTTQRLELRQQKLEFVAGDVDVDLTPYSANGDRVLLELLFRELGRACDIVATDDVFVREFSRLIDLGLIAPRRGHVDWGDLARSRPFCHCFGANRGTVIDRYYLLRFIDAVKAQISGRTLDVGTSLLADEMRVLERFPGITELRTLDCAAGPGVDICGDLTQAALLPSGSVDSILCFNVLEHCADIQQAVDNMREWLAPGGRVFCMVPSIQRIHDAPNDYWRLLPGAVDHLFRSFGKRELYVYGNLHTSIAALAALCIEDLRAELLDEQHPDYPVATCIVATR
jgi:SAM-dependent methyltransferase